MNRILPQLHPADPPNADPPNAGVSSGAASAAPSAALADLRAVHRAATDLRRGIPVVLRGAAGPALLLAAETVTALALAELAAVASGPPVLVLSPRRAAALSRAPEASPAPPLSGPAFTAYTVAPDALGPELLRSLADPTLARHPAATLGAAITEAPLPAAADLAIRLAKIARLLPAVLIAPHDGPLAGLLAVEAAQIEAYPAGISAGLRRVAEASVPLDSAPDSRVVAFRPDDGGLEHLAIIVGQPLDHPQPLVRVHSACLTGDLLGSLRCDCGPQLRAALARMTQEGSGVLLYLAQEGRGIGIANKLRAYTLQDRGEDTVDANLSLGWEVDERSFLPAAIMLEQLGLRRVRVLTNNPAKLAALAACGIEVAGREPHVIPPNGVNDAYLRAKADRLGHLLG